MTKVIIELEFDNHKNNYEVNDSEVYNYLQELMLVMMYGLFKKLNDQKELLLNLQLRKQLLI